MQEEPFPSEKIFNLDNQAKELGMGGKLSPDGDENLYKKRMQQRKDIQAERLQLRKTKKGLLIVFTGNGKGKTTKECIVTGNYLNYVEKINLKTKVPKNSVLFFSQQMLHII